MIYFVQDDSRHYIKIGFTESEDVGPRVRTLQTASPGAITLLLAIPGDRDREKELHEQFAADRVCGEWFHPSPALLLFLLRQRGVQAASEQGLAALDTAVAQRRAAVKSSPCPRWLQEAGENGDFIRIKGQMHPDQIGDASLLKCPVCGFEYNHPLRPAPQELTVEGSTQVVSFAGECGHSWSLCFGFHKGNTFVVVVPDC